MAEDVIRYADSKKLDKFTLLGHSMGGKTAMNIACLCPSRINGIIVVDAPPKDAQFDPGYVTLMVDFMKRFRKFTDLNGLSKEQALAKLYKHFPHEEMLIYALGESISSVNQAGVEKICWDLNIDAIYKNLDNLFGFEECGQYPGQDVKLILGGNSYKYDKKVYTKIFPNLLDENVAIIPGAGHRVITEKPEETLREIISFLNSLDNSHK